MHTPNNVINIFNVCFMCIQVYDEYITSNIIRIYNKCINVCARVHMIYTYTSCHYIFVSVVAPNKRNIL